MNKLMRRLFARKAKPMTLTITFTPAENDQVTTQWKFDRKIPVGYAVSALDRLKGTIQKRLTNKAQIAGYTHKDPKTRVFISKQTLGDIL